MYTGIVKNINESLIVRSVMDGKPFTKQEVAKRTGLSFPTVGKITDDYVRRGMILEMGTDRNVAGGRKPKLYRINEDFTCGLLMFFDENDFSCAVINMTRKVIERFTRKRNDEGYLATMRNIISEKLATYPRMTSVSIGVHGGVDDGKILYIDGYEELEGCDLKRIIQQEFGLDVAVENNMRAVVYGMALRCRLLCEETVVCFQIAKNGPGCGILVNGKPLSGFAGLVGEVGYLPASRKKNMQEIALSGFPDTDLEDYFARLIVSACVYLNPRQIVLYENRYIQDAKRLEEKCKVYLPEKAVPEIILSPDYGDDFMEGLKRLSMNHFYPSYQIIQE